MSDYISREDSLKAIKEMFRKSDMPDEWQSGVVDAYRLIEQIPAADVREVVLCKDCVYYIRGKLFGDMVCDYHYLHQYHAEPNEYCSHGEKREES